MTTLKDKIVRRKEILQELEDSVAVALHALKVRHEMIEQKKAEIEELKELNDNFKSHLTEQQLEYINAHIDKGIQVDKAVYIQCGSKICVINPRKIG